MGVHFFEGSLPKGRCHGFCKERRTHANKLWRLSGALCALCAHLAPEYDLAMNTNIKSLPVDERIQLVEDLWDSIAADQNALALTEEQKMELDKRLRAFELDRNPGRLASDVFKDIRSRL